MLFLKSLLPINEIQAVFNVVTKSGKLLLLNGIIVFLLFSALLVARNQNIQASRKMQLYSVKILLLLAYLLTVFGRYGAADSSSIFERNNNVSPLPSYISGHPRYESKFHDAGDRKLDLDQIARTGSQLILVSGPDLENLIPSVFHYFAKRKVTIHHLTLRSPQIKITAIESLFYQVQKEVRQFMTKKGVVFTFRDIPKELMDEGFAELLQQMTKDPLRPIFVIFERNHEIAAKIRGNFISQNSLYYKYPF